MVVNTIKKYWQVLILNWQEQLFYKVDWILRFILVFMPLIAILFVWIDIFSFKNKVGDYNKESFISYYILATYLSAIFFSFSIPLSSYIRRGYLSIWLTKPINQLLYYYVNIWANVLFSILFSLPFIFFLHFSWNIVFWGNLNFFSTVLIILLFLTSINIFYLVIMFVNILEFWIVGASSIGFFVYSAIYFLTGVVLPVDLFPDYLAKINNFLPFKYTIYFLIQGIKGGLSINDLYKGLSIQLFWIILGFFLLKYLFKKGLKRYEAYGG